jgi:pimeloyl-ACP methyl ester carboxylesterase
VPVLERDGARIHYEVYGEGYPLLLFAPGGMHSVARLWRERPDAPGEPLPWFDPTTRLAGDFRVVAMDQRNAGASTAPVGAADGWETYAADHLALLDHLGAERAHVMGGCIGSSYCLGLVRAAPERVSAAVLQNPIGLSTDNHTLFLAMFDQWGEELRAGRPDITGEALAAFRRRMFGGDFVFSVGRDFVRECPVPLLVLAGNDEFHPRAVAREIAELAPRADLVLEWAGPDRWDATWATVRSFLLGHTPPGAEPAGPRP